MKAARCASGWAHEDKTIELRQIKTGLTNGRMIQVLEGIKAGERVITRGSLFIEPGRKPPVEARRGRQASRDCMNALIAFALKHRLLMLALFVTVMAGGALRLPPAQHRGPIPTRTPPMVDIVTQKSRPCSAEEIERYITIPIETQTAAIKNLHVIRTISPLRAVGREAAVHLRLHL